MQFNCGHFKKCNDWLAQRYGPDETIDWDLIPKENAEPPTAATTATITSSNEEKEGPVKKQPTPPEQPTAETENSKTITKIPIDDDTEGFEDDTDALEALIATTTEGNESARDPATKSDSKPDSKENDPSTPNHTVSA